MQLSNPITASSARPWIVPSVRPLTLGDALDRRLPNNFDFLRLLAALFVIFSHSYFLTTSIPADQAYVPYYEPFRALTGHDTLGTLAVRIFFIISGLLVARSFLMDPASLSYARKRALRILPGLLAAVLFCILIVGPIATTLPLADYFRSSHTWTFLINSTLLPRLQFDLPGVFAHNPHDAVNGSLWSLPLECLMYVGVVFLGGFRLLRPRFLLPFVTGALLFHLAVSKHVNFHAVPIVGGLLQAWAPLVIEYTYFFFAGTALLVLKDRVVFDARLFAACLAVLLLTFQWPLTTLLSVSPATAATISFVVYSLTLPYLILYLSFTPLPLSHRATAFGDLSYGTYLYAWPVQQLLLHAFPSLTPVPLFLFASAATLLLAAASWRFVEKPFLRLKPRRASTPEREPAPAAALGTALTATASGGLLAEQTTPPAATPPISTPSQSIPAPQLALTPAALAPLPGTRITSSVQPSL